SSGFCSFTSVASNVVTAVGPEPTVVRDAFTCTRSPTRRSANWNCVEPWRMGQVAGTVTIWALTTIVLPPLTVIRPSISTFPNPGAPGVVLPGLVGAVGAVG